MQPTARALNGHDVIMAGTDLCLSVILWGLALKSDCDRWKLRLHILYSRCMS